MGNVRDVVVGYRTELNQRGHDVLQVLELLTGVDHEAAEHYIHQVGVTKCEKQEQKLENRITRL